MGDQLSRDISSLKDARKTKDVILMGELWDEATSVRHHKKKIILVLSAMRHFAEELKKDGWRVDYQKLDDKNATRSFTELVNRAVKNHEPAELIVTEPSERRVLQEVEGWEKAFSIPVEIRTDDRFIASHQEFDDWAKSRKQLRMEYFYREMRRKTGLLMEGDKPAGGEWNYDKENRKPASGDLFMPSPKTFKPDAITKDVIDLVKGKFAEHFGDAEPFQFAVTRKDALKALDHFIKEALPRFGDFQDAMLTGERFLYHSVLSAYINIGLLDPLEVCKRAENAYLSGDAPINAAEGFIRQIIGWREYVRGHYWRGGEEYVRRNFFGNERKLPAFYWSGETDMACIRETVTQTLEDAYAHHIQRLMVTGLFAMLAGIDPYDVHEWYLIVYFDAFEWVEAPNVIGMSQYADGGALGSKPYAASGAYINRMSDYCKTCRYAVTKKTEEDACPFNTLYWDFLARNEKKLKDNPRLAQMYRTWAKMEKGTKLSYRARARAILDKLDAGERI
ncbi:cryptochrome/photolyase family protein [Hyphococcus sp.]|uniref:cryptochrome/photolyase family protein n=1 Tax=Hyphococcus sp. TaxID=2038636 RepID=UPI003D0BAD7D